MNFALFLNGVYKKTLEEILQTQCTNPDQPLFLQPYSSSPIVKLKNAPPSVEFPIQLYTSTTDDLAVVSYIAEIVGWEDKTRLNPARRAEIEMTLESYQPEEGGLFNGTSSGESINLISVRRLRTTSKFSVSELVKIRDGKPLSTNRSRAGGYSYVRKKVEG